MNFQLGKWRATRFMCGPGQDSRVAAWARLDIEWVPFLLQPDRIPSQCTSGSYRRRLWTLRVSFRRFEALVELFQKDIPFLLALSMHSDSLNHLVSQVKNKLEYLLFLSDRDQESEKLLQWCIDCTPFLRAARRISPARSLVSTSEW